MTEASIPAFSTIGIAIGVDEEGTHWRFAVDPGVAIIEALEAGEKVSVDVQDYQLLGSEP